jgi:UDP-glucose 4-epimerase
VADQIAFPSPGGSGVAYVTGAGGFLGGAVAAAFQRAGWRVAGFDLVGARGLTLSVEGEVAQQSLARTAGSFGSPEVVFHAAGGASVGASIADPEEDRRRTVGSLRETLAFLEQHAPRARLIYPSSAAVYGAGHAGPIQESSALDPISPYGAHKAEAEALIADAAAGFGLEAAILRFFSIYGPGLRKQLLWDLAQRLAGGPVEVELGGTGAERRDFLYVDDAVRLIGLAASAPIGAGPLVLNGGSGQGRSVREIAEGLAGAMGSKARIGFNGQVREGDPKSLVADISGAEALGFEPAVALETGLGATARWLSAPAD